MAGGVELRSPCLVPLVEHSNGILRHGNKNGTLVVTDKIPTPCDELGIPQKIALIKAILGIFNLSSSNLSGKYGKHHMAWPRNVYSQINIERGDEKNTASDYRGVASLLMTLPIEVHNCIHAITIPPKPPAFEIMKTMTEDALIFTSLYDTVRTTNLSSWDAEEYEREEERWNNFWRKLEGLYEQGRQPYFHSDVFETLLSVNSIVEARRVLRPIATRGNFTDLRRRGHLDELAKVA